VRFFHEDAKYARIDWRQNAIVYLTDLLWDQALGDAIFCNLAESAPSGTIVVSNRPGSAAMFNMGFRTTGEDITVPVSWNEGQQFFFFELNKSGAASSTCVEGGLPVQCTDADTAIGGQVCYKTCERIWHVQLEKCKCTSESDPTVCKKRELLPHKTLKFAESALLEALNDVGIPTYVQDHVISEDSSRFKGYMTQFVLGLLAHITNEEHLIRNHPGIHSLPEKVRERLWREGNMTMALRLAHSLDSRMKVTLFSTNAIFAPAEPESEIATMAQLAREVKERAGVEDADARDEKVKLRKTLDHALCEGLLAGALWDSQIDGWRPETLRLVKLRAVITDLMANETEIEYCHEREMAVQEVIKSTNYSEHQFGYGSTYFSSFLRIFTKSPINQNRLAIAVISKRPDAFSITVLGSSLGWQCIFANLAFGISAHGFELVTHRFHAARRFAVLHELDDVRYHNGDAAEAAIDWEKTLFIYMTDLLWDKPVRDSIHLNIAAKAESDTVLISNRHVDQVKRDMGFRMLDDSMFVTVSWMDKQQFYIYDLGNRGQLDK